MVKHISVEGFQSCINAIEEYKGSNLYVMFSGSKVDGKSWCPDCVIAEPVVTECTKKLGDDAVYIYCAVGGREFWKDQSNVFRTDNRFKLKCVPTLMKWGQPQRLEEEKCAKKDLIEMLMEDD